MENKKYQQFLIQQAKLQNQFYTYNSLQPCAYFWKQLVIGKQTPFIMVPDTLILNDKQSPLIWIYTNSKGMLQKSTNINLKDFVNKITNYCSPNQLSATLKRVTYHQNYINGNQVKLFNARYLQNASLQQLGGQGETLITLQRYIKSNGNNAFICRSVWKKNKNSQCFIITNKKSFYDENQPQNRRFLVKIGSSRNQSSQSTIVKAIQGNHLNQTCKYLTTITDYMKLYRGIVFSQIVGDFIKDEAGNWWLINIKAFRIQQKYIKNPIILENKSNLKEQNDINQKNIRQNQIQGCQLYQKQKYQKTKICRYCQKSYLQSQLNHYMTIRMLIQTDRYLLHLGKNYKWLRRSDIQNVDSYCLYQQHKICQRCYLLYMQIQNLMQIQNQFLKRLGFQIEKRPKQLLMDLTNQEQLKNQSKAKQLINLANCHQNYIERQNKINYQKYYKQTKQSNFSNEEQNQFNQNQTSQFPKLIQLGPNSNIIFQENTPIKNDHIINKMIRYRMVLYLKQIDQIQFPQFLKEDYSSYNFFLEYQLFGIKNKLKLDLNHNFNFQKKILTIKKLKINYFFSHSHQDVYQYLTSQYEDLIIKITVESKFSRSVINQNTTYIQTYNLKTQKQKKTIIGKLILPIKQYFNSMINFTANKTTKKDFYKFFSVSQVPYGWGLQGSIGIVPSQSYVNTSRMIFFTEDNLIYLPNQNYYYCEFLPEEWIDVIKKDCIQKVSHENTTTNQWITEEQKINTQIKQKNNKFKNKYEKQQSQKKYSNIVENIKINAIQKSKDQINFSNQDFKENQNLDLSQTTNDSWKKQLLKKQILNYDKSSKKIFNINKKCNIKTKINQNDQQNLKSSSKIFLKSTKYDRNQ